MTFQITPKELLAGHVTPIDTNRLADYVAAAAPVLETVREEWASSKVIREQRLFIAAGCKAILRPPRNASHDPDVTYSKVDLACDQLHALITHKLRKVDYNIKPPNRGVPGKYGFSIKSREGFDEKAYEYSAKYPDEADPYTLVADIVRTTVKLKNVSDLQKVSEILRPCSTEGITRFYNALASPDSENDLRRILINYRTPCGVSSEIQVRLRLTDDFYDASEDEYQKERQLRRSWWNFAHRNPSVDTIRGLLRAQGRAHDSRLHTNHQAGQIQEVAQLQSNFRYFSVDGFPVIMNTDNWENYTFGIGVNPLTGQWETDQRIGAVVNNSDNVERITIDEAVKRAEALSRSIAVRDMIGPR